MFAFARTIGFDYSGAETPSPPTMAAARCRDYQNHYWPLFQSLDSAERVAPPQRGKYDAGQKSGVRLSRTGLLDFHKKRRYILINGH
jgi:hypothetical protein